MSKIDDYEFIDVPTEVTLFKDDVRDLLNNGKYQMQLLTATPTFSGNPGEFCVVRNGTNSILYIKMTSGGTSWSPVVAFTATS